MTVAAGEEQVQQRVEALGEILHMFAHGTRHVHQTEHDGLRDGLGMMLITAIAQIDGIDVGNEPTAALQPNALLPQQNGRASCRERGVTYVSLSEVAVIIKKKKQNKK